MNLPEWLNSPERQRRVGALARQILQAQGERCAECGNTLYYEDATKRAASFDIICQDCYRTSQTTMIVVDEFSE